MAVNYFAGCSSTNITDAWKRVFFFARNYGWDNHKAVRLADKAVFWYYVHGGVAKN